MKLILLSGGTGKRLWPLSNDSRSKQFLKLLGSPKLELESMLQRVWRQLESNGLANASYVSASKAQLDILQNQLGHSIPIIVEPHCRDTFPAISLAAAYLYSKENVQPDEVIGVVPVDLYAEDQFFNRIKDLEQILLSTASEIALIGVKPAYPSEKYGYIIPEDEKSGFSENSYVRVSHFVEKPNQEEAKRMMEQNALWNCGVFAFKLGYIIEYLKDLGFRLDYDELVLQYDRLSKKSFDYEVVEKARRIVAAPYNGSWKDLGTWNTLTEEMEKNPIGNGMLCSNSVNTHLINELNIPAVVLGISNAVVTICPDGILVADKAVSPKIKDWVQNLDQRPMYEERRWGRYRVLDHTSFPHGGEVLTKRLAVKSGGNLSYQLHHKRSEVWTIISGEGEFVLDDQLMRVKEGDVLQIPVGAKHGIRAITDLEFIEVQMGSQLIEEDIVRIYMTWAEVTSNCKNNKS